jgi:ABC-type enterochelin transport system permease subunit
LWSLLIALIMGIIGQVVYVYWGYNYFTAAVFLTACYNFFWGVFHYRLDKALTRKAFWEILIVSLIIGSMVISVTNFSARLLDSCQYKLL